jgi:predicted dienelactone hydrolase
MLHAQSVHEISDRALQAYRHRDPSITANCNWMPINGMTFGVRALSSLLDTDLTLLSS